MNNRKWLPTLFLILSSSLFALGNGHTTGLDDLQQLLSAMEDDDDFQLLGITEEETTIATRSKLNADYVPGMITILRGEVMHARGATTVAEALAFVPGIEKSHDRVGNQVALVRGIGGSFASGNIKILVDNTAINAALSALANPVMLMPIELVERIEVVRGPGSALYGEYAYAGVINVITRKDKSQFFAGMGSFGKQLIGGVINAHDPDTGATFSLNLAGWRQNDTGTQAGEDVLYNIAVPNQGVLGNAPGDINDESYYRSALAKVSYQDFMLQAQFIEDGHGDYFGTLDILPDRDDDDSAYTNKYRTLSLSQKFFSNKPLSIQLNVGWQRYDNAFDIHMLPPGYLVGVNPLLPEYPNGWRANGLYREQQQHGGIDIYWNGWENHQILYSVSLKKIKVKDAWQVSNVDPKTRAPLLGPQLFTGEKNWVDENKQREIRSMVLQDEYRYSQQTTYTLGGRYDDYNDVGSSMSPRLAGVFRYSDEHIFKAQYAEAFRPPTFYEEWNSTATNPIKPETIRTFEFAYIHRLWNRVDRLTLFHSKMRNLIVSEGLINYENLHNAKVSGIEVESERYLLEWLKLNANISYSNATNTNTDDPVAGAAKWLSNIGLMMNYNGDITASLDIYFVGSREREAIDPRKKLPRYYTIDSTFTYNLPNNRLTLRMGIKNLLDKKVVNPATMTWDAVGNGAVVAYNDDYPQPGRNVWAQLEYLY